MQMEHAGFDGAFKMLDTFGLPLALTIDEVEKASGGTKVVALDSFVRDAVNAGWGFDKAIATCREALVLIHGPIIGNEQAERLEAGMKRFHARYWPDA